MTDLQLIREMMTRFDTVVAQIKEAMPHATAEEIQAQAVAAMNTSLGF